MNLINIFNIENIKLELTNFWGKKKLDKSNTNILFVDDENFPVVEKLQKAGWSVKKVKDIMNIQDDDVQRAHIIFVDYKGVGKYLSENDQGIGIIKAIKTSYGNSKRVILYSGHNRFNLGLDLRVADNILSKNSDVYEFITIIEAEIKKIK
jgi:hypothetical protein